MKKFIYSAIAAIGLLLSPSCSDENEALSGSGNEALVSFSVNLADGIQTKAIGDGEKAVKLNVYVFEENSVNGSVGNQITALRKTDETVTNKEASVTFNLVKGKTYNFLFWADEKGVNDNSNPFSINDAGIISVDYGKMTPNAENSDAFVATVQDLKVNGNFSVNVELKRPFAQLNFLTTKSDIEGALAAGIISSGNLTSQMTISQAAKTLNPFTNTVSDPAGDVTFVAAAVPVNVVNGVIQSSGNETYVIDAKTYYYLSSNYFLVNAAGSVDDDAKKQATLASAKMKIIGAEGDGLSVQSVPVRMNYRTNIYGNLLTASGTYHVTINENFNTPQPPEQNIEIKEREVATEAAVVEAFEEGASKVTLTTELTSSESSVGIIPQTYANQNTDVIELVLEQSVSSDYVFKYKAADNNQTDHYAPAVVHITIPESAGSSSAISASNIQLPQSTVYVNGVKVNTLTVETAQNTLVVGPGTVIETLKVKKGKVRIEKGGKVGTIERETGNEDATTIVFLAGGELTNTPEDDNIIVQSTITSAEELFAFAEAVNAGDTYAGRTVYLGADIDLNNADWTPIGANADQATYNFQGTFDGQNHTIKNFKVARGNEYKAAGFFGALNGTAKNFTIENAKIVSQSTGNAQNITDNGVAVVAGSIYGSGLIKSVTVRNSSATGHHYVAGIAGYVYGNVENCTVENSTFTSTPHLKDGSTTEYNNGDKVGGIVGYLAENTSKAENCSVSNVTIKGYRDLGGIAGYAVSSNNVTGCSVSNVTLIQDNTHAYEDAAQKTVGAIIGRPGDKTPFDGEYASEVTKIAYIGQTYTGTKNGTEFTVTAQDQIAAAVSYGASEIILTEDIDANNEWTPLVLESRTITINGNGHTIQGLNRALVLRTNGSNITIKDLTITGANISYSDSDTNETALGVGGFISYQDYAGTVIFSNCHLKNSAVSGRERAAGLIGYTSGNQLTITDCTVEGCTIKATGSTGGLVAHTQTTVSISNSKVENSTIESAEDRTGKAAIAGGIIGTIVGVTTFDNVTVSGNTVTNNGATPYSEKVGRVVSPGTLTGN